MTYNYELNGVDVRSTTVYVYQAGDYETAMMTESQTRKGEASFTDPFANELLSTTYYELKFGKGDEVADYTHDWKTGRDSYYFYGTAGQAGTDGARASAMVSRIMSTASPISCFCWPSSMLTLSTISFFSIPVSL